MNFILIFSPILYKFITERLAKKKVKQAGKLFILKAGEGGSTSRVLLGFFTHWSENSRNFCAASRFQDLGNEPNSPMSPWYLHDDYIRDMSLL